MKETIETILWMTAVLALVFLFKGNPSLFDKLHERAMQEVTCET